jgi:type VI secretion system protein ImpF
MATPELRERLQPALLDRLTDEQPDVSQDPTDRRGLNKQQLRAAVLRDLAWLLNAVQPMSRAESASAPLAAASTLNFGMPPLSGQLASRVDLPGLTEDLRQAILRFEPRILEHTLSVTPIEDTHVLDAHNVIEFEIRGHLWAQPIPLELLLRTQLDLEAGQVRIRDAAPVTLDGGRR